MFPNSKVSNGSRQRLTDGLAAFLRVLEALVKVGAGLAAAACIVMVLQVTADVVARNVFNRPIGGTLEMVTYLWMPTVSLAFGYAQLRDEHIRVTLLLENSSARVKK